MSTQVLDLPDADPQLGAGSGAGERGASARPLLPAPRSTTPVLTVKQRRILALLRSDRGALTVLELAHLASMSPEGAAATATSLCHRGLVARVKFRGQRVHFIATRP